MLTDAQKQQGRQGRWSRERGGGWGLKKTNKKLKANANILNELSLTEKHDNKNQELEYT